MNTLALDKDEVATEAAQRWVARMRREYGIKASEGTCWFVEKEQTNLETGDFDSDTVWLGRSPGDALATAELYAGYGRRDSLGRWTLEVFGDGMNGPLILRVRPHLDDEYRD